YPGEVAREVPREAVEVRHPGRLPKLAAFVTLAGPLDLLTRSAPFLTPLHAKHAGGGGGRSTLSSVRRPEGGIKLAGPTCPARPRGWDRNPPAASAVRAALLKSAIALARPRPCCSGTACARPTQ